MYVCMYVYIYKYVNWATQELSRFVGVLVPSSLLTISLACSALGPSP